MSERYSTSDIWVGAVLLAKSDARLVNMQTNKNGRRTVFFTFEGENLSQLAQAYCQEKAVANVSKLRTKLNDLRDLIFQDSQSIRTK